MKKNGKLLCGILCLAAVMVLFFDIYSATRPAVTQGSKSIVVQVVHKDGTIKELTYHTDGEYLGTVLQEEGLIQGEMGQFGLYITEVDGERAVYEEDAAYWAFFQGEAYASQGVDLTPITEGSRYSFVYTYG